MSKRSESVCKFRLTVAISPTRRESEGQRDISRLRVEFVQRSHSQRFSPTCVLLALVLLLFVTIPLAAQPWEKKEMIGEFDAEQQKANEQDPQFKAWPYFASVHVPDKAEATSYYQLELTADVIARGQLSLNDLRLADADGKRLEYVLQVLNGERRQTPVRVKRSFNAGLDAKSGAYQESLELEGVVAPGYNEVEIVTSGRNFRRRVKLEGADNESFEGALSILPADSFVYRFESPEGKAVESSLFRFDYKQFRFLRLHVFPDANNKSDAPKMTEFAIRQTIVKPGEEATRPFDKGMAERQPVAASGGPGSAWYIDLGQAEFVSKMTFRVDKAADRPIQLKVAERGQPAYDIFGVDATWNRSKEGNVTLVLRFPEVRARRFRLVITDFANEPLHITPESYSAAKRRLVFADPAKHPRPLKLYLGNPDSGPPRYDLEKTLPAKLDPPPVQASLDPTQDNPNYIKPLPPFHERHRWAVYAVLGAASLVLVALLVSLGKQIKPAQASLLGDVGQVK